MKILLTGFEPFGGDAVNPSWEAALHWADRTVEGAQVISLRVPVVWASAAKTITDALQVFEPDAILMLGQAGGRMGVTPERVGINVQNGKDNAGVELQDEPIVPDGPDAYLATLPVRRLVNNLRAHGIPAEVSNSAGTYLCNQVAYAVPHWLAQAGLAIPAGFVHVPMTPEEVAARQVKDEAEGRPVRLLPSLSQEVIDAAVGVMLKTVVAARREVLA